jgi:hypothetical protein
MQSDNDLCNWHTHTKKEKISNTNIAYFKHYSIHSCFSFLLFSHSVVNVVVLFSSHLSLSLSLCCSVTHHHLSLIPYETVERFSTFTLASTTSSSWNMWIVNHMITITIHNTLFSFDSLSPSYVSTLFYSLHPFEFMMHSFIALSLPYA